jgi:hypothetical protein
MPARPVGVADTAIAAAVADIDVMERASPDIFTTTTADPGSGGTTLAVTLRDRFPQAGQFKIKVEKEIMYVTAGWGTGAGSFTVTRGQDGTTAVAHAIGVRVSYVTAVQRVEPVIAGKEYSFLGRASGFRTPGRAGTAGQKIFAIHNATGSPVLVDVDKILVDFITTVAIGKVGTIIPPIVRIWKFTAVPTNGTALAKLAEDSALSSNASVTVWGDASADGTGSTTTLTVTLPAGTFVTECVAPNRVFGTTGTGTNPWMEDAGRMIFFPDDDEFITLRPLEGIAVFLDYTVATANPTTDFWLVSARWKEYIPA